jgi:hypothetical protein
MPEIIGLIGDALKLAENFRDLEFKEKMRVLRERVLELQDENDKLRAKVKRKEEMKPSGPHNYFYHHDAPETPYCPTCWQKDEKAVLLPAATEYAAGAGRKCHVCESLFVEKPSKPQPSIAFVSSGGRHRNFGR